MATTPVQVTPSGDPTYDSLRQTVNNLQAQINDANAALISLKTDPTYINYTNRIAQTGGANTSTWVDAEGNPWTGATGVAAKNVAIEYVDNQNAQIATANSLLNDPTNGLNIQLQNAVAAVSSYEDNNPTVLSAENAASTSAFGTTTVSIIIAVGVVLIAGIFMYFHFRKKSA